MKTRVEGDVMSDKYAQLYNAFEKVTQEYGKVYAEGFKKRLEKSVYRYYQQNYPDITV